jgi:hypothetical protein
MNQQNDWWASLNHGGLLIAPNKIKECFGSHLDTLPQWRIERLRRELTRFDGTSETLSLLLDFILEDLSGLPAEEWQKAQHVNSRWALSSFTREQIKPRRIWVGPNGEALPVFVPEASATRQASSRLGVGHSRRLLSRVLEWLRRMQQPLALVTNGRQWRLVHAGQDYDAWSEWDIDLWFEEGRPGSQVLAWRHLIDRDVLIVPKAGEPGKLIQAILDSRKGQAELSSVLGERVRQAVEELITASHESIEAAHPQGQSFDYRDLYIAGTRIVMRCIIALFAETRGLLPVDNRIYQQGYSIDGLRQQLDRRAGGRGSERLAQGRSAWPRLVALFNLVYQGSAHEALPIPQYSGGLFRPGRPEAEVGMERALALLESPSNQISDKRVRQILRLLTRTKVRVRQGHHSTWVDGPVDFSALSSEYIGILYEGLLDYELKRAAKTDPIIFLNVGRQPALPLSRLENMDEKSIKQLFEVLKKKDTGPVTDDDSNTGDDTEEGETEDLEDEVAVEAEGDVNEMPPEDTSATPDGDEGEIELSADDLERAQAWLEGAAEIAGLIKKPKGKSAGSEADFANARRIAGSQLCARLVAPGQFYLVRWGGTRKGTGTFYTRPQLAGPTVRRTLQPLAFRAERKEVDPRTGLEEVVEWSPRTPEEILDIKVCDPAMGSGSFPVSALRYLTDALVQSLYHHQRIDRRDDGAVARLADGQAAGKISDQLIPLPPDHEAFEETLRVQLKRHIVERCIYGVDLDQLAVELGRMALWVETMDRTLPFGFLDHKLKVGNALVGAWFDTFQEYPAMAWEREGGDSNHDRFVHHFHEVTATRGKKAGQTEPKGDVWTSAIKACKPDVRSQLIDILRGQLRLGEDEPILDIRNELADVIEKLHGLPVHDTEARARLYQDQVLNNVRYHEIKARMDLWCALWFWPGDKIDASPMPAEFANPSHDAVRIAEIVAEEQRFFHWELEFPDAFTPSRAGFDGVIGNPPWEIQKPNSKEFFSNIDPLYRAYGKQEALAKQVEYFENSLEDEKAWLSYAANLKARSNWIRYAGGAFGDAVHKDEEGKRKHDLNLGGRGRNSFAESANLHAKWRKRRDRHPRFADAAHPFTHQGSADLNTYKMFLEQSHALLRDGGRIGMIAPSGIYSDKGTTALRSLFLQTCNWQWLFGFENRLGIFDIHRSFKFCAVIIEKGSQTKAIRTAFMHRNVDDWNQGERFALAYPKDRVESLSPYSMTVLEIQSEKDLEVLQKIFENGILLGDKSDAGWGVNYATEFHMTNDSKFFPPKEKWEARGYQYDGILFWVNGDKCALPVYNAKMFDAWDFSSSGWVRGKGRGAVWEPIGYPKRIQPEYLMEVSDFISRVTKRDKIKVCFKDISTAIHKRTMMPALIPELPAVNAAPTLRCKPELGPEALQASLSSFIFDYVSKYKIGYLHLNYFIISECPLPPLTTISSVLPWIRMVATSLGCPHESFAAHWIESKELFHGKSWRQAWAVSPHERVRCKAMLDAVMSHTYDLSPDDLKWILRDADQPIQVLTNRSATAQLNQKGFWRVDKDIPPELRQTVLSQIAFRDLKELGLDAFLAQNGGEGWMIPETLRLADYGLGHDKRAREYQPVAASLGARFFDWQLNENIASSWEECEVHAKLVNRVVPTDEHEDELQEEATGQPPGYQTSLL